jgi:hypothetical protein
MQRQNTQPPGEDTVKHELEEEEEGTLLALLPSP